MAPYMFHAIAKQLIRKWQLLRNWMKEVKSTLRGKRRDTFAKKGSWFWEKTRANESSEIHKTRANESREIHKTRANESSEIQMCH